MKTESGFQKYGEKNTPVQAVVRPLAGQLMDLSVSQRSREVSAHTYQSKEHFGLVDARTEEEKPVLTSCREEMPIWPPSCELSTREATQETQVDGCIRFWAAGKL